MDKVRKALLNNLAERGFPNLAVRWQPFLKQGCTIYLLSEQGYQPRDTYALFWAGRYLLPPTTDDDHVEVVPVCCGIKQISAKNLIIFGRLRAFESDELVSEVITDEARRYVHFRFIDDLRLLEADTGNIWQKNEEDKRIEDYGVLRLWRQRDTGRSIIQFGGLGQVGTLGTALAITDCKQSVMTDIEQLLSPEEAQPSFVEILVKAEWVPNPKGDPIVINPSDVKIKVIKSFYEIVEPNWPLIHFRSISDNEDLPYAYEAKVIDVKGDKEIVLSYNTLEVVVLAAIAKYTEKNSSMHMGQGGYISYGQIAEAEIVKEIVGPTGLDVPTVRATVSRLRKTLSTPEWRRAFPNLLLETKTQAPTAKRKIRVLRLRAQFKFEL